MRRQVVVLSLSVLLVLLALAPRAIAPIPRPAYARGDFWSYRTFLAEEIGFAFAGNTTITAGDVIEVPVQGSTVRALEMSVEGIGTFSGAFPPFGTAAGTWVLTGTEHWDAESWSSVRSFARLTATGAFQTSPSPVPFTFGITNETTRRIDEETFGWPVADGATGETRAHWNASVNLTIQFEGSPTQWNTSWIDGDFVTTHAQNGTAILAFGGATFDTYRIDEAGPEGPHRVRWYAPRVGGDVRQEEYNETGGTVASSELTDFRYQAGEPPPPFPWLYSIIVALATSAAVLLVVLGLKRRRPFETGPPRSPAEKRSP